MMGTAGRPHLPQHRCHRVTHECDRVERTCGLGSHLCHLRGLLLVRPCLGHKRRKGFFMASTVLPSGKVQCFYAKQHLSQSTVRLTFHPPPPPLSPTGTRGPVSEGEARGGGRRNRSFGIGPRGHYLGHKPRLELCLLPRSLLASQLLRNGARLRHICTRTCTHTRTSNLT